MKETVEAAGIIILEAPVKYSGTMGHVDRYHIPLHYAFKNKRSKISMDTYYGDCSRMAVYCTNDTTLLEVICAILVVLVTFNDQN